jgi:TolA-binding protein
VKRNFAPKSLQLIILVATSLTYSSCSSLLSHREQNKSDANAVTPQTVSKEQYDELARKYQELVTQTKQKLDREAPKPEANLTSPPEKNEQLKPEMNNGTNLDPSELVNHIDQVVPDHKAEGVDVLAVDKVGPKAPESMGVEQVNFTDDVDDQIVKLREATDLIKVNKFENALIILKELENSKEKQIVVRSKIMLGDLLFGQGEYDLAMQVYEEVVKKYAFSGYVLKALGKLVACSEKLKQPEKQAKYYSLLHDFFESV